MVGSNVNKKIFPFFNSVKVPVTASGTSDPFYANCVYETLNVEVSGMMSGSIKVEGCINVLNTDGSLKDDDECSWTQLAFININTMTVAGAISANGIYSFGISGMNRIRVVVESISGSATIVGVAGV